CETDPKRSFKTPRVLRSAAGENCKRKAQHARPAGDHSGVLPPAVLEFDIIVIEFEEAGGSRRATRPYLVTGRFQSTSLIAGWHLRYQQLRGWQSAYQLPSAGTPL